MTKFLLLAVVIFVVIWYLRGGRHVARGEPGASRAAAPPPPQDMIECPVCHVHLPRSDALPGPGGQLYCCADHVRRGG